MIVREGGFGTQVRAVRVLSERDADLGTLILKFDSCDRPDVICDTFFTRPPPRPPVPIVDLCEALESPSRYGSKLIAMIGMLTTINEQPALTATCETAPSSGGLTWSNTVLLPRLSGSRS